MMCKKFGYIGAQGAGKTTRVVAISKVLEDLGIDAYTVKEQARDPSVVGMLGDSGGNFALQWQIMMLQEQMEMLAERHSVAILDRTVYDCYAYGRDGYMNGTMTAEELEVLKIEATFWAKRHPYHRLYLCKPKYPLADDGLRSMDVGFQEDMVAIFDEMVEELHLPVERIY